MDDISMYQSYEKTNEFLSTLAKKSRGKIPCNPVFKMTEDEMIVGVLTETNQFVQISEPKPISETTDNIITIKGYNYLLSDSKTNKNVLVTDEYDKERVEYIKKIKLETNFYNVFRNTIRILLNKYENLKIREKIEEEIKDKYILYSVKLISIIQYLKKLIKDSVVFSDDYEYNLMEEISTCIVLDETKCSSNPLCAFTNGNTCQLLLPKKNLLNNKDNEIYYFGKMADELIRYNRINSFIFKPQTYLSFGEINYNLKEKELLIVQSLLNQEYFDKLIPAEINKYVKYNTYDTAKPIKSKTYSNRININELTKKEIPIHCVAVSEKEISSLLWKKCFPESYGEYSYERNNTCNFQVIIDIVEKTNEMKKTVAEIRADLLEEYVKYLRNYKDAIVDILINEGKKQLISEFTTGKLSMEDIIYSDEYFLTNLDIWLLVNKYRIPAIFISSRPLKEVKNVKTEFFLFGEPNQLFVFIFTQGSNQESIPKYTVIKMEENNILIPLTIFSEDCKKRMEDCVNEKVDLEDYLKNYKIVKNKKQKLKLVLENDEQAETETLLEEPLLEAPVVEKKKEASKVIIKNPKKTRKQKLVYKED
jgi:hypothetical protein